MFLVRLMFANKVISENHGGSESSGDDKVMPNIIEKIGEEEPVEESCGRQRGRTLDDENIQSHNVIVTNTNFVSPCVSILWSHY